ncbi:MAG TPA: hypothetical protein VER96_15945 [Polyangiaceae bacterium]|nr:hypothetical protein [Polyangiaceae bacterium]
MSGEGGVGGGNGDAGTNGEAGLGGESGAAGTSCGEACACDGHACACKVGELRSCAGAGLLGSCAAGTQTCGTDRHWSACSVQAKSKDTCAANNDDNCNGVVNEGCPCIQGQQRPCSDGGLVGKCAAGKQTCGADATWGTCSIVPAASDTCQPSNNDNCSGPANEGCLCIEGVTTRPCGVCQDGIQTCTDGRNGQFGACIGGTNMTTYYLDADGDGHAVNISTTICGAPPAKYITGPVDDCYDSNADVFPGQTNWFQFNRGDGSFDYNCVNGEEPQVVKGGAIGCLSCNAQCGCATLDFASSTPPCGSAVNSHNCWNGQAGCEFHNLGLNQLCR